MPGAKELFSTANLDQLRNAGLVRTFQEGWHQGVKVLEPQWKHPVITDLLVDHFINNVEANDDDEFKAKAVMVDDLISDVLGLAGPWDTDDLIRYGKQLVIGKAIKDKLVVAHTGSVQQELDGTYNGWLIKKRQYWTPSGRGASGPVLFYAVTKNALMVENYDTFPQTVKDRKAAERLRLNRTEKVDRIAGLAPIELAAAAVEVEDKTREYNNFRAAVTAGMNDQELTDFERDFNDAKSRLTRVVGS